MERAFLRSVADETSVPMLKCQSCFVEIFFHVEMINCSYVQVMRVCWNMEPTDRPTFTQLKPMLKQAELEAT